MSKENNINYSTFLEFASLLNPDNYSDVGYRKSPRCLCNKIKMFDMYLFKLNNDRLYEGCKNDIGRVITPYEFCQDEKLSEQNLGFNLEQYTLDLIERIKNEGYIPGINDLDPYQIFLNHKLFQNSDFADFDLGLEDYVTGFGRIRACPTDKGVICISELNDQINDYIHNYESTLPCDCYYDGLSKKNCVARLELLYKDIDILYNKLGILGTMDIHDQNYTREYNTTLRELGNYTKIRMDLEKYKKTHKCLPKSKSKLEF